MVQVNIRFNWDLWIGHSNIYHDNKKIMKGVALTTEMFTTRVVT